MRTVLFSEKNREEGGEPEGRERGMRGIFGSSEEDTDEAGVRHY